MKFFEIVVEQLDLATELLHEQHPMQSRLALILIDNTVEYALHRYAKGYFARNPVPHHLPITERRRQLRRRSKVSGQYLAPKLAFARSQNVITEDQARFVRHAHRFRNQAYHAGRTHDSIIMELSITYFNTFCKMLPDLAPGTIRMKHEQELSPRARKYLNGNIVLTISTEKGLQLLTDSLERSLPVVERSFGEACRTTLTGWLEEIRYLIEYLVQNDESVENAELLIRDTQHRSEFWAGAPPEGFTFHDDGSGGVAVDPSQEPEWKKLREEMKGWQPGVSEETLERWERRINGLVATTLPGILVQKYCKLVSEIEPFMKMIDRRCAAFDRYIEELMDDERDTELRKRLEVEGT